MIISMNFFLFFLCSSYAKEDIRMRPFSIYLPLGSHILFSGRLCMPAPSVCFWTPRLSLGHPGSFTSVHDLKCMRTQTASLFNVPFGKTWYYHKSSTPISTLHIPELGIEPVWLCGEAGVLTTTPPDLLQ